MMTKTSQCLDDVVKIGFLYTEFFVKKKIHLPDSVNRSFRPKGSTLIRDPFDGVEKVRKSRHQQILHLQNKETLILWLERVVFMFMSIHGLHKVKTPNP